MTVPSGVIEGFYGPPWSHEARLRCIEHLARWGMTHYVWAAKQEPRHRDDWAEPFTDDELSGFGALAGHRAGIALGVALTPGPAATADQVVTKLAPAVDAGAAVLVVSFDDLPEQSHGARHRELATEVRHRTGAAVWVVPTHYAGDESSPYLDALCDGLPDDVLVMWTGPSVVTDSITAADARARAAATGGRRPFVWDNVPVNDVVMSDQLNVGPLRGRDPALLDEVSGVLWNPMPQAEASLLTLQSCAAWLAGDDPVQAWEADVEARGVRPFVEGVLGLAPERSDLREWLKGVAACAAPGLEDEAGPWLEAVRAEARLGLAALDVLDLVASDTSAPDDPVSAVLAVSSGALGDPDTPALSRAIMALTAWRRVRAAKVSVFGGRLVVRPVADQDGSGRFRMLPGSIVERSTVVDDLVREALDAAGLGTGPGA